MEIQPSSQHIPISAVDRRANRPSTTTATDAGDFAGTTAVNNALAATPDIRPEAVARGQALVEAPEYPPARTLAALAHLFAFEFGSHTSSPPEA